MQLNYLILNGVANTLKDIQKPCPGVAGSDDVNERLKEVVLSKFVNDLLFIATKLTEVTEDLIDNRQYSTSKYDELMWETNELRVKTNDLRVEADDNQETANSKYHELRQSYEDLSEAFVKHNEKSGTTYVRLGTKTCPAGTEMVYTGYAGISHCNWLQDAENNLLQVIQNDTVLFHYSNNVTIVTAT